MVGRNILNHKMSKKWDFLCPSRTNLNLENFQEVEDFISANKPDLIIHAAGHVGGIQTNINNPINFLVSNFDIGRNVVMAAKKFGVRKLINLGSSCMYPRNAPNPLKEEMILQGELEPTNEGYALAKIAVAKLCEYINNDDSNLQYKIDMIKIYILI